jgi:hypothetical protein
VQRSGKAEYLNNWRPISLLNVDYKILSKVITNRLKTVASLVIGAEQTCGLAGRSIFDNLHFLRNTFDYCKQRQLPCIAVCFDQAKAFDSLDHDYLFEILRKMNFGPTFLYFVKLLYTDIYSSVLINGFLTFPFPVTRSVRQGCGLSPSSTLSVYNRSLFAFLNVSSFKGVPLPSFPPSEARISMYADDTTVLASDTVSVNLAIHYFNLFCAASGAKLNLNKCEAIIISGNPDFNNWPTWLKTVNLVKIGGIYFGANALKVTEEKLKIKLQSTLESFKHRHLTYLGKATLINTLVLSKLWHHATCISLSDNFFKWLDTLIFKFIWPSIEKISRITLHRAWGEGGISLINPKARCQALQIKHLFHFISSDPIWGTLTSYWCALPLHKWAPTKWSNHIPHSETPSLFYTDALKLFKKHYGEIQSPNPKDFTKTAYQVIIKHLTKDPPRIVFKRGAAIVFPIWKKLKLFPLSPESRNLWWQISHQALNTRAVLHNVA